VPKLAEIADTLIYGEIWERRNSPSAIAASSSARADGDGALRAITGHLDRALDNGVTQDEIAELITHLAFYSGWPTAMTAAGLRRRCSRRGRRLTRSDLPNFTGPRLG